MSNSIPTIARAIVLWTIVSGATPSSSDGEETEGADARRGLALATEAARAWAGDAKLVYLENDAALAGTGAASRWGYVFRSTARDRLRGYSIEGNEIVVAETLGLRLDALPIEDPFLASTDAFRAAEEEASAFRAEHGVSASTMVLMRGAFHPDPDRTAWLVVYRASGVPALFVVVDAATGTVTRTWRG